VEEGARISGIVVAREGSPVPGATVRIEWDDYETSVECDAGGRFESHAPRGKTLWVSSSPEGYAPGGVSVVAPASDVRVTVTPESILAGRVVEQGTERPIAGVRVYVDRSVAMDVLDESEATTDAEGRFRLRGLRPGRYEPLIYSDDWRGRAGSVALGYRETSREIRIELTRCPAVRGRVMLPEPLERRGYVRLIAWNGGRRSGTIEEDGSFEVRGVDPGSWLINIDAPPFIEVAARELEVEVDVEELLLAVRRGARISGEVLDDEGNPAAASIALYHGGWGRAPTEQAPGRFAYDGLRPGRYRLTASATGARGRATAELDLAVGEEDIHGLELVLRSRRVSSVRGRLVDADGHPIAGGHASIVGMTSDSHGSADGSFVIEGTEPGIYTLVPERIGLGEMKKPDGSSARVEFEVVDGEDILMEIVVETSDQRIEGRIVDAEGEPFPNVLVAVARETEDRDEYEDALSIARNDESVAVPTNEHGRFAIESLARGTYTLVAYRPEGEELIATGVRTDQRVTLMLDAPGTLSGRVKGATTFELCARRPPQFDRVETVMSRNGSWTIDGLSPGKWSLQIIAAQSSASLTVIVRSGRTTDIGTIALEPFGIVRGRVIDESGTPLAGAEVVALSTHPRTIHGETDAGGWYEIEVPAGWVHVDVPYGHHGSTRSDVKAGEVIELPPIRLESTESRARMRRG
jgi:protocatechuate 3,4-dioxygenase beta subunit